MLNPIMFISIISLVIFLSLVLILFSWLRGESYTPDSTFESKKDQDDILKVKLLNEFAKVPVRNNYNDAGLDLFSPDDVIIPAHQGKLIPLKIAIELPEKTVGIISDRSSMGKKGLKVMGGVVDEPYRGEIMVMLWNLSNQDILLSRHDKIAQLIIYPVLYSHVLGIDILSQTERGENGFGSSGK